MKSKYLVLLATVASTFVAHATTFTWDASGGAPLNDGAGNWNATGGTNWFDGVATYGAWGNTSGDTAVFGVANGAAGTITVGTVNTGAITFNAPGSSNYTLSGGTITLDGAHTITTNADATISSVLAGAVGLIKAGTGKLTLSGNNSGLSGGATISAGTLKLITSVNAAGSGAITLNDASTVSNNTTLEFNAGTYANAITVANQGTGISTIALAGSGTWNTGTITLNKAATLSGAALSGNNFLGSNVTGAGALTFSTTNGARLLLHTGSADVSWAGFTGDLAIGDGTGTNDTVLEVRTALNAYGQNKVTINSDGILQLAFNNATIGALNGTGIVRGFFDDHSLTLGNGNGNGSFSGKILNNARVVSIIKTGTGTQTLSGANDYSGGTTINAGSLVAGVSDNGNTSGALGGSNKSVNLGNTTGSADASLLIGGAYTVGNAITVRTGSTGNTLTLGGSTANASTFSGVITLNRSLTVSQAASGTLNLTGNITSGSAGTQTITVNNAGDVAQSTGVIGGGTGTIALTKIGTGTLTLSGANSYTGATNVDGGTLRVNGSTHASSAFTVGASGTLGGTGAIGGTVTVNGTLAPGASIESLSTGAVTFANNSTFAYELDSSTLSPTLTGDLLDSSGALDLASGTMTLTLSDLNLGSSLFVNGQKLTLISYLGTWDGDTFTYGGNELFDGDTITVGLNQFKFDYNDTTAGLNGGTTGVGRSLVTMTVVPEPAAALLGSLGLLALLRRRRA
jgi:fibronectin-binding autotransporter adhesin